MKRSINYFSAKCEKPKKFGSHRGPQEPPRTSTMRRVKLDDSRASRTIWHLHQRSCAGSPTHALRHALMCHACSKSAPFIPHDHIFPVFQFFSLKTSFLIIKTYDISVSLMMPSAGRVLSPGRTKIRPKWVEVIRFGQVDLTRFAVPG